MESLRWVSFHCQSGSTTVPGLSSTDDHIVSAVSSSHAHSCTHYPLVERGSNVYFDTCLHRELPSLMSQTCVGASSCRWPQPSFQETGQLYLEDFSQIFLAVVNCWSPKCSWKRLSLATGDAFSGGLLKESRRRCVTDAIKCQQRGWNLRRRSQSWLCTFPDVWLTTVHISAGLNNNASHIEPWTDEM